MFKSRYLHTDPATLRNSKPTAVGSAIHELLEIYKLNRKYQEMQVCSNWDKIMGPIVANRTTKVYIENKVLFVYLDSAPLKHQMMLQRERVISLVNAAANQPLVVDIFLG